MTLDAKRMEYVSARLKDMGQYRVKQANTIAREGAPDGVSGALLLAIGIRESGLRGVLGDKGHARGAMQIHDAYHDEWLRTMPGCRMGHYDAPKRMWVNVGPHNWVPVAGKTAMHPGHGPRWGDSCRYVIHILTGYVAQAKRNKIPEDDALRVAIAAYNLGMSRALQGYREGDPDTYTTGSDYSHDVLRRKAEVAAWLQDHPNWS